MRTALLLAAALATLPLQAQTAGAPPVTPPQVNVPHDAALNPKLPTVFIVGDSTARNGLDLGWGDHVAIFFDTDRINLANRAIAGRSSRTYINEGHWAKVLAEMKPGDFLLLQMGHNDGGDLGGAKPRGSLKGIGEETQDVPQTAGTSAGQTETVHTYGWYMRKMITEARAKGVTPLLLTLTIRNIWTTDSLGNPHIERDMGYTSFIQDLARQENVSVLDIATTEADALESLGPAETAALFPIDHTHTSARGARLVALAFASTLRASTSPLAKYLR